MIGDCFIAAFASRCSPLKTNIYSLQTITSQRVILSPILSGFTAMRKIVSINVERIE